jgi:cystathionine beta-lyase/cystathionine gamma-synthase
MTIDPTDIEICLRDAGEGGATSPPIVQTSLFTFPTFGALVAGLGDEFRQHVYTRGRNPTVMAVERKLAALERGEGCLCFGSGMAAISGVLLGLLGSGDHVLFVNHTYGPTLQLAEHLERFGITHDTTLDVSIEAIEGALRDTTRLIWLESPGTMLFRVVDLSAVAQLARRRGILTCIDNSWATPLFQKPLTHGIDIVVHTATKYLGGHSDLIAGAVVTTEERLKTIFYRSFLLNGGVLGPFDAWLLHRGLLTLPARMSRQGEDALHLARALREHPDIRAVHHPALIDAGAGANQLNGYAGVFSFELRRDEYDDVTRFIDALRHCRIGVSWGGVESLVISPQRPHNGADLTRRGLPRGLIRLSVGLEGTELLRQDLLNALEAVNR